MDKRRTETSTGEGTINCTRQGRILDKTKAEYSFGQEDREYWTGV
jgi:hypothetical protein